MSFMPGKPIEKQAPGFTRSSSNLPLQLIAFFVLLLAGIWTGIALQLQSTYEQILLNAERDGANLARAFAEQARASLRGIDLSLLRLREEWRDHPAQFKEAVLRQQDYFANELIFQVAVIDADGMLVYSNLATQTAPVSLADREHFRIHRDRKTDQLFISKPLLGRVSKRWSIQFTRPILGDNQQFMGVIVMSVAPEYFSRFYDTLHLGRDSVVALIRSSGEFLARAPHPEHGMGKSLSGRSFLSADAPESGSMRVAAQTDAIERIFSWRQLREFGLVVSIGQSVDGTLEPYYFQRKAFLFGGALASALLAMFAATVVVGLRHRAAAIAALESSEERNRIRVAALEAVGNGVIITDTDARIEWVNAAFETLTGYTREEAIGRRPSELVASGQQNKAYYAELWKTILSGHAWRGELVNRRADGTLYDEELVIAPVVSPSGKITHFVGIKQDITARKRNEDALQQSHDLLGRLSAQVPGVIYQYRMYPDGSSSIPFASRGSIDVYELEPQQLQADATLVFQRHHPEDAAGVIASIRQSAHLLEPWHHEYRVVLPTRGIRWVMGDARPQKLEDGSILWHGYIADITERKEGEQALRASEQRWKFALEGAGDAIWEWDIEADTVHFSKRQYEMLCLDPAEPITCFTEWKRYIHPEDLPELLAAVKAYLDGRTPAFVTEYRIRCKDGSTKWLLARGMVLNRDAGGKALSMIGTQSDITERKLSDEQLRVAAVAFESQEGMMVTDASGTILRVNSAFEEVTGYSAVEALGKKPSLLKSGRQGNDFYRQMWSTIGLKGHWEGEIWNRKKNGEIYPEWLVITAVKDSRDRITHYVSAFSDITTRKNAEAQIRNLAFYDPLTNLPNRRLLMDRVTQVLAASARSGRYGALMLIDLDHFKTLNDTLGHDVGDQLLIQVSQRLSASVREGDTVARLGGDEFVVMIHDLSTSQATAAAQAEAVAEKILAMLNAPYALSGTDAGDYRNTPSIGISQFRGHEQPFDVLLKHADIALYEAKDAGRNTICFYSAEMQAELNEKALMETGLRDALANGGFHLYYQPQVDRSHRVVAVEALIRWEQPGIGLVPPARFISLAEETGLILQIGQWVLETACAQLAEWARYPETRGLQLSINVSAKQFHQPRFVSMVRTALEESGADPSLLKLELTETMVLADVQDTVNKMHELRELGVTFALDDFGTGYSSLSYLKRLPLDQVKIDKSFVRNLATDVSDAAIVQTIISMSHTLGLQVIAEGVETPDQLSFLERNDCRHFQGYLFGRPMLPDQLEELLLSLQAEL
ncbi:MAG TPA: EAL domain-containing protein [Noviherbaspirillum sp.]